MQHKEARGRIRYTSAKPGLEGTPRGEEHFHFTWHGDGRTTLRAHCRIEEPDPPVLRDIVYSQDAEGRPHDCFVRLTVGDRFLGTGLVLFDHAAGFAQLESFGPGIGRVSQRWPLGEGYEGFGTHPIAGDAWLTRCMDPAKGPHRRDLRVLLPSADHRGATPPLLAEARIGLDYLGDETVDVAAGRFRCHRLRYVDDLGPGMGGKVHPPYELWVTADPRRLFVKGGVGGAMGTAYELVELTGDG
jgi:hypothetical protein